MKAVILAGGLGTRISEETQLRPKPMVTIGGKPILWHIMKTFSAFGIADFVICLGYKGDVIKDYFINFRAMNSDIRLNTGTGHLQLMSNDIENWNVTLVDTGLMTNTGERLKRVRNFLHDEDFFFTYGDGLTSQDLGETLRFHLHHKAVVTMTGVIPPSRYGSIELLENRVVAFEEKSSSPKALINGGYCVINNSIMDYLDLFEEPSWELDILPRLAKDGNLACYQHKGFWLGMDTLRDKEELEKLWGLGKAPWL